jgi:adhesin transport system outer membrane protein
VCAAVLLLLALGPGGGSAARAQTNPPAAPSAASSAAPTPALPATPPPGALPQTFEQLRVNTVADQLIRYLGQVVRWVDVPDTRAPTSVLSAPVLAAVERHPEARIATEQRIGAAYGTREARAGWLPQVSAGVEGGRRSNDEVFKPDVSSVPAFVDNSKAVTVSVRQLVWDFGAVNHQIDSRLAVEMSVQARAQAKRSELTLRALSAWLELFRTRESLAAGQMNVLSRQQILSFIEERTELGASSTSDVLRARARLADAQAAEVAARNQLSAAEAVYVEFFDQAAPGQLVLPEVPALDGARLADLAPLVSANPLVVEARRQAEAAAAEARAAAAALLPTISLDANLRRRDLGSGGTPGNDWSVGLAVRQNVFNGGADQARAQQAEQRALEARLGETNLRRQLERALAQSVADVQNSSAAVLARKESAQVAAVALEAVREQFAFRRGSLLDLLRAQEELHQATRDLIDSVANQTLARYRFLHLSADLAPMFNVPVDAPAPALAPLLPWLKGRR